VIKTNFDRIFSALDTIVGYGLNGALVSLQTATVNEFLLGESSAVDCNLNRVQIK